MGFDDGRIILNNANKTYHAGETIFGKLEFQQDKLKTFRGIYVKIKGFAHVHWTTRHSRRVNDRTEYYTVNHDAHEDYFSMKQYLVGDEHGENHLQAGNYSFDFQFRIPAHCPSSFEHKYGHIRYEIKIVVDRAFKFDQEKKFSIRVISPLDLNQNPYCKEPLVFSFDDIYSCCCMSSGFCETLVKLPVAGFCPDQIIPVELHCSNRSSVEIERIKLTLIKIMRFTAHNHPDTKYDMDQIIEIKKGPINGFATRNWTLEIEIPSIDIYNVNACQIIDIDYEFKVTVIPDGCHSNSTDAKRIILGTIPLVGDQGYASNPLQYQMPEVQTTKSETKTQFQTQNYKNDNAVLPYPVSNPSYPGTEAPYPPGIPVNPATFPAYPGANPPYPSAKIPYPDASPSYPKTNSPNSNPHQPYPIVTSYPSTTPPYPNTVSSDAKVKLPYPAANPPYPVTDSPYPNPNPGLGFRVPGIEQSTSLPPMPVTNITVAPSAPEPSTPDDDKKPDGGEFRQRNTNTSNYNYPYNPEFINNK